MSSFDNKIDSSVDESSLFLAFVLFKFITENVLSTATDEWVKLHTSKLI